MMSYSGLHLLVPQVTRSEPKAGGDGKCDATTTVLHQGEQIVNTIHISKCQ